MLDQHQTCDQADFRAGFSCEDQVLVMAQLIEKQNEFQKELWAAAIDYDKALDTIEHDSVWSALEHTKLPTLYIRTLANLYEGQSGIVQMDKASKQFLICRGTKQGDPTSPILFNSVLQYAMEPAVDTWKRCGCGINMGEGVDNCLTNPRFGDVIILLAKSKAQLKRMLVELNEATGKVGVSMHRGKTKILTNSLDQKNGAILEVLGNEVQILITCESTSYLGRALNFARCLRHGKSSQC